MLVSAFIYSVLKRDRSWPRSQVILAVEGKADEPFGSLVWAWARGNQKDPSMTAEPRRTRVHRLESLSKASLHTIWPDSSLRDQLLHRTVSVVLEAQLHGAAAVVVLVHVFGPDTAENLSDFSEFLNELGGSRATKGVVPAPISWASSATCQLISSGGSSP